MAPIQSRKTKPIRTRPTALPSAAATSAFTTSKRDKRAIKRSLLLSKIEKSRPPLKKRRRPNKKLVATLESLAGALPEADDASGKDERSEQRSGQARLIRHKSLRSRPGALKRKEKMEKAERERFGMNMARLVGPGSGRGGQEGVDGDRSDGAASKWAMLRGFIEGTMERRPEFAEKL